jgi:hypothetical protein
VTLPAHDAQPSKILPSQQQVIPLTHSTPDMPPTPAFTVFSLPSKLRLASKFDAPSEKAALEHPHGFATYSWDLATGGLKTLTAKRELPPRVDRRTMGSKQEAIAITRGYTFALAIMVCIILMLIGAGVVLFVMLQP